MSQSEEYKAAVESIQDIADNNAREEVNSFINELRKAYSQVLGRHPHLMSIGEELKLPFKVKDKTSLLRMEFSSNGSLYTGDLYLLLLNKSRRFHIRTLIEKINKEQ